MAITIDYATLVINVPQADMLLLQSSPVEVRQLDINDFRLELDALMDDDDGIVFPTNHVHTPPLTISGVTLARVVEIINGYTVTFSNGSYNVNVVGGNSNIADVTNKNTVGVNTANSAGLQDPFSLQSGSFVEGSIVYVNQASPFSGTNFPKGTRGFPVNNFADALVIALQRGIVRFGVIGAATIATEDFSLGYEFVGDSIATTTITLDTSANFTKCEFSDAVITGVLDGNAHCVSCSIQNLTVFNGSMVDCGMEGTVTLGPGADAVFLDCFSLVAGGAPGSYPIIDMGGASSTDLVVRHYAGGLGISNCSDAGVTGSLDMVSGRVVFTASVSAGDFTVRGVADVTDSSTGAAVITDSTISSRMARSVGLAQDNVVMDKTIFDAGGLMTSARMRVFASAAAAAAATLGAADDADGEVYRYNITAVSNGQPGQAASYRNERAL